MTVFIILFAIVITLLLNLIFVRKIANKTYKICMGLINFILSFAFIVLFICFVIVKNHLNSFIDSGIS